MRSRETIFLEGELASQLADWHRKKGCRKLTSGTELARESISEQDYRHSVYRCMQNILVCRSTYLLQPSQNRDIDQSYSAIKLGTQYAQVKVRQLDSQIKLVCQLARQHTTPQQSFTRHLASSQVLAKPDGPSISLSYTTTTTISLSYTTITPCLGKKQPQARLGS